MRATSTRPARELNALLRKAIHLGEAINVARTIVDTPPRDKRPIDLMGMIKALFFKRDHVSLTVWDHKRLLKERMHLLLGVGAGSAVPPQLVHLRYRPPSSLHPFAFIGKGVHL